MRAVNPGPRHFGAGQLVKLGADPWPGDTYGNGTVVMLADGRWAGIPTPTAVFRACSVMPLKSLG